MRSVSFSSRWLAILGVLAGLAVLGVAQGPPPPATPPQAGQQAGQGQDEPLKNLQVLPKDSTRQQVLQRMRTFTAGLGVQCNFCHVEGDFSKDDKPEKATARRMIAMVETINKDNFDGRPEIACYTCHQGNTHPHSRPPAPAGGGRGGSGN